MSGVTAVGSGGESDSFRFAVGLAIALAVAALSVAAIYDLPMRDPDGVQVKTYIRLPLILLATFLADVTPRALRLALVGLGAWYVTYVAFRNLKSYVPFVNDNLYDDELERVDRVLWLGHDPAGVLHEVLGTGAAAHILSFIYDAWIVLVPASLVIALAWSHDVRAGEWFVTAIADALGGGLIGAAGVLVAAWGTGNHRRGVPRRITRQQRQSAVARPR